MFNTVKRSCVPNDVLCRQFVVAVWQGCPISTNVSSGASGRSSTKAVSFYLIFEHEIERGACSCLMGKHDFHPDTVVALWETLLHLKPLFSVVLCCKKVTIISTKWETLKNQGVCSASNGDRSSSLYIKWNSLKDWLHIRQNIGEKIQDSELCLKANISFQCCSHWTKLTSLDLSFHQTCACFVSLTAAKRALVLLWQPCHSLSWMRRLSLKEIEFSEARMQNSNTRSSLHFLKFFFYSSFFSSLFFSMFLY